MNAAAAAGTGGAPSGSFDDVMRIKKTLDSLKAADTLDVGRTVDVLTALQGVPMTVKLLKKTKVGIVVGSLNSGDAPDAVKAAAKKLLKQWKAVAKAAGVGSKKPGVGSSTGSLSVSASGSSGAASPAASGGGTPTGTAAGAGAGAGASAGAGAGSGASTAAAAAAPVSIDGLPKIRQVFITQYETMFKARATEIMDGETPRTMGIALEQAVYSALGTGFLDQKRAPQAYKDTARSLIFSVKANDVLFGKVLSGDVSFGALVRMTPDELLDKELKAARVKAQEEVFEASQTDFDKRNRAKILNAMGIKQQKTDFRCKECGNNNVQSGQRQTRSADEPMTTFCECLDCGNRWKFC